MGKLGKACSLPGDLWEKWLRYVLEKLGPKMYVMLWMTQALCLRITQVAQLRGKDFRFDTTEVWLKKFKKHKAIAKPLVPSVAKVIKKWQESGLKTSLGTFAWDESSYLFPSRKGSKKPYVTKDFVCHKIAKVRKEFMQKHGIPKATKIKSHSGRRHSISAMALGGVPDHVGMAWAQISEHRVYKGYVDLDPRSAFASIRDFDKKARIGKQ